MIDISKQKININCPDCNRSFSISIRQVSNEELVKC